MTKLMLSTLKLKVVDFTVEIKQRRLQRGKLRPYFQGEFRAYGLSMASAYIAAEARRGIVNPARNQAAEEYKSALETLTAAYDLPEDGGRISSWFPEAPHSRADMIALAENEADIALLKYSAPLVAA
jgi:hypothetical protein